MTQAARVTITGAAGQIGYQLAFRIASGQLLGANQPIILQLLEIPPAMDALKGVAMELEDCAFPTLDGVIAMGRGQSGKHQCIDRPNKRARFGPREFHCDDPSGSQSGARPNRSKDRKPRQSNTAHDHLG